MESAAIDYARCTRCGTTILAKTAVRYGGRCAPCSNKRWYDGPREIAMFVWFFTWLLIVGPFLFVFLACRLAGDYVAKYTPGTRANLLAKLQQGWQPDWQTAKRCWSRAKTCFQGPVGYSAMVTPEFLLIKDVASNPSISTEEIFSEISVKQPMVAAYCIVTLVYRQEAKLLRKVHREVFESKAPIRSQYSCIAVETELGKLLEARIAEVE